MNLFEVRKELDSLRISAEELTKYYLDRIEKYNKKINAYITVCDKTALSDAKKAQKLINEGKSGMFTGIPFSVKDNICTKGIKTTCASKMLEDFIPFYDATVVEKLKKDTAIILGKTNMDEFAMGSSTETSYYGTVKNPYDLTRVSGGSSGGAAASVSAKMCLGALGSDTGGSIPQPASYCGVVGLKPTYGTVSRWGLIAFASSFDQIGICANSAIDSAYILNGICGVDDKDETTSNKADKDYSSKIGMDIKGLKIGIPKEFFTDRIDKSVRENVMGAIKFFESSGCEIIECSVPSLEYAISAYYLISSAEASSNLSRYDGIRFGHRSDMGDDFNSLIINSRTEGFGNEVKRRIMLGNYALSSKYYDEYYNKALKICGQIKKEYAKIFELCDIIITPTAPSVAKKTDQKTDIVSSYLGDICTVPVNIAGLGAISVTCGYGEGNMPVGMTLVCKPYDESTIIAVCDFFENNFTKKEATAYEI